MGPSDFWQDSADYDIGDKVPFQLKGTVADDYDITYPFRELGWEMGEEITPHIYTKKQWAEWSFLPFYKNVERDKKVLL